MKLFKEEISSIKWVYVNSGIDLVIVNEKWNKILMVSDYKEIEFLWLFGKVLNW